MATINYRDPGTQQWVELSPPVGAPGPAGAAGGIGPTAVSIDAGNFATINPDGGIYVAPVTQAETDLLYVNVSGDTMTGTLLLPDPIATPPSAPAMAATKGYVDQLVTASASDPVGIPVRNGLVWIVVEG